MLSLTFGRISCDFEVILLPGLLAIVFWSTLYHFSWLFYLQLFYLGFISTNILVNLVCECVWVWWPPLCLLLFVCTVFFFFGLFVLYILYIVLFSSLLSLLIDAFYPELISSFLSPYLSSCRNSLLFSSRPLCIWPSEETHGC